MGSDVIATTSGTLTRPDSGMITIADGFGDLAGSFNSLYYLPGVIYLYSGLAEDTDLPYAPTSAVGDIFGFGGGTLYLPYPMEVGESYSPVTTFTWVNRTLAELNITTTPKLAFQSGDQMVTYVAVPEPSSTLLFLGGALAVAFILRRKKATQA